MYDNTVIIFHAYIFLRCTIFRDTYAERTRTGKVYEVLYGLVNYYSRITVIREGIVKICIIDGNV